MNQTNPDLRTAPEFENDPPKFFEFWKGILGLQKWRIRFGYEKSMDPQGRCFWDGTFEDAIILIRPLHFSEPDEVRESLEELVLHELVHLMFAELGDPAPPEIELAVTRMAHMLYLAAYGSRARPSAGVPIVGV